MENYELRPYQANAVKAVSDEFEKGHKHTLLVLPTGTGKTIVFAKVVELNVNGGKRALILAHRSELLDQASEKLKLASGLDTALEKAEYTSIGSFEPVTVASVQTLSQEKRLNRFPHDYFDLIVVDEAHHCMSDSYQKILNYFNTAKVLGVTATPDRSDQKNLGQFFDSKAYEYTMHQAVKEGYLCPVKAQMIPLELDIRNVGLSNGDYAVGEIGSSLEPYLNQIALEMLNYCKGRKTVVFLPLVKTSQKFCELLNVHGLNAIEVNGNSKDRERILADFEAGEYDVLCNSMLLTEGWDCPAVDTIVVLRPTKVRSLYQQMVGRGMRLSPGKKELLLLDFLWMTERHDLCRPSALISKNGDIANRIDKMMMNNESGINLLEAEEQAGKDILQEREDSLARQLAEMKKRKRKLVDPLQYAMSIAAEDLADYEPTFAWECGPITDSQKAKLEKLGINPDEIENCGKASLLITKLTILASMAQEESRNISENVKWGKKKKAVDGYSQVGYSTFLGYDKHEDAKIGLKVNEEEATIVRFIYREFLKGRSVNSICKMLEEKGIKTPGHKDHWRPTTVASILKNEKYKGDCEMQKTYVKNFLDHVAVKNRGELEKIYVEDHHEPIVSKDHWMLVQLEFERRGKLAQGYNSSNEFSCKLICGDCGSYYGAKVLHSTDKYRSVKYRCNKKYDNGHVCQTPFVTDEEVKSKFILAYNEFIGDRGQLVEDCEDMIKILDNTSELEERLAELNRKAEDIIVLVKNLIEQNSTEALDQDDFQKKYDSYDFEHRKIIGEIEAAGLEIEKKKSQAKYLQAFIDDLNNRPNVLEAYDEDVWVYLVDKATVNRNGSITFQFRNGKEITID